MLHLSDLTDENEESGIPEIVINSVADEYQRKIESLQAKMDGLKTKVCSESALCVCICDIHVYILVSF